MQKSMLLLSLSPFLIFSTEIVAQDGNDSNSGLIEEIIVTARKREETLQDVPFSVAAQTERTLRNRGAVTLEDVSRNVAGFSVQNLGPGQSQIAIRGVSAGQIVRDQPGVKEQVGVYLDESVISLSLFTPDIDVFDMNRVEVLRGPQGTLFGSGSLSGTVRYISNQPVLGETEGYAEVQGSVVDDGEGGGYAKGVFNVPVSDSAALRAVAYYRKEPGFIDAVQPDFSVREDVNGGDIWGTRIALRLEPNERLTITPRLVYQDVEIDGFNRFDNYNILANPFTTTRPPVTLREGQQFTQFTERFTDEFTLLDATIQYEGDTVAVTSVTSWTDRDVLQLRDATQLTASITGGNIALPEAIYTLDAPLFDSTDVEVLTQELRFSGGSERFQWVAGFFYSDIERQYSQVLDVAGFEAASGIPTAGPLAGTDILFFSNIPYDFEQFAIFGEGSWSLGDRWNVTAGLRYYDFDEERILNFDGIFADQTIGQPGSTSSDGVSPRLMVSYDVTDNTTLNAQISEGFRLGGINDPLNLPLCSDADRATFGGRGSWEDEELLNFEIGAKSTVMGGRGTFNVALFRMDIDDLQATLTAGTCSSRVIFNVPEAESTGLELEWAAQLTDNFDFAISASFTDSELKSSVTSTDAAGNVSVVGGVRDGARLPTVPETQVAVAGTYSWPVFDGAWEGFASGVWQYVDERFTQFGDQASGFGTIDLTVFPLGDPNQTTTSFNPELGSYDLVNVRLGARNDEWEISFFVNNLFDENAFLALDQERGTLARQGFLVNQPRTFGITTRIAF